jgi:hypothetical protein
MLHRAISENQRTPTSLHDNAKRGLRRQRVVINSLDHISHHSNNPDTLSVTLAKPLYDAVRIDLIDYNIPFAPLIAVEYIVDDWPEVPPAFEKLRALESIYLREGVSTKTPAQLRLQYEVIINDFESAQKFNSTSMSIVDVITSSRESFIDGSRSYYVLLIVTGHLPITDLIRGGVVSEGGAFGGGQGWGITITGAGGNIFGLTLDGQFDLMEPEQTRPDPMRPPIGAYVRILGYYIKPFILNVDVQQGEPWLLSSRSRALQVAENDLLFRNDVITVNRRDFILTRAAIYNGYVQPEFFSAMQPLTEPANRTSAISRTTFHIIQPTEVVNLTRLRPDQDAIMPVSYSFLPTDISSITVQFRQLSGGDFYFPFTTTSSFDERARIISPAEIFSTTVRVFMNWSLTFDIWYYDQNYVAPTSSSERVPMPI